MGVLEVVRCDRLRCTLSAVVCATRATARWPSGRRKGKSRFTPCGRCAEGRARAARLEREGWTRPPDSQPAIVLEEAQRAARDRWARSFPMYAEPEVVELGALGEAALATPDDAGSGVDLG